MPSSARTATCAVGLALAAGQPCAEPPPQQQQFERVIVSGSRASLESAQARKRDSADIVDAMVAAEIHRLPDLSVADSMQRITGVQVVRDRGEGSLIAIRGLIQVETLLNGREIFSAGNGRTLDYSDLAAETLAGIDVYKSASAERIEGGLGGTVDLRTRRPFDFGTDTHLLAARWLRGELVGQEAGQVSALVARRRALADGGELAVLFNFALQDRAWREDQKSSGVPLLRRDLVPGSDLIVPSSTSETTSAGRRRRSAASALLEWRPTPAWALYAEGHLAELQTRQDSQQINVSASAGFVPGSLQLFPGSNDVQRITWTNAPFSVLSFARDTVDRTRQFATGARWAEAGTSLAGDLSLTRSANRLLFSGPFFAGTAAQFTQELSGAVPATAIAGTDLADPAALRYTGLAYRKRPFAGELLTASLDARWHFEPGEGGMLDSLALGWRHALRRADDAPGLVFADVALSGLTAADTPGRVRLNPYGNFLDGRAASIGGYLVGELGDARDPAALREAFGIGAPIPVAGNPLGVWRIRERSEALYLKASGHWPGLPLDGQAGLRLVDTRRSTYGDQSVPGSAATAPIALASAGTDLLPSASLRWRAAPGLQWRVAASRTITRPDFNQLSPSLVLVPNPVDPSLNQGSAGNPALRPVRSHNLDLALERESGPGRAASLTLFWKQVEGFIVSSSQPEEHDGLIYQISRPRNADPARIRGAELAWQRFFDGLPGAWRGLGLQANYTYIDSRTPDHVLGVDVPLQNLSRHSANLIGMYELGPWSARLAWNWRSRFLSGSTSVVGLGALPAWTQAHGWLDASLRWRIDERLSWSLDAVNLTGTLRRSDYGRASRPQSAWVNDRQLATSLSVLF